jgi:hypothetical protein
VLLGGLFKPIVVRTTNEVVPPGGWRAYRGEGYDVELQALVAAQRHAQESLRVTVVVSDARRFRVFETDARRVPDAAVRSSIVKHVCQAPTPSRQSWTDRKNDALAAIKKGNYQPIKDLITETTGIEANVVGGLVPHTKPYPRARSGVVNFDPTAPFDGRTFNRPERAERQGDLPAPAFVIGPAVLTSPELLRTTVEHEARHAHHHSEVIKLIKEWRQSGVKRDFHDWLEKHKSKIPKEIYWVATKQIGRERTKRAPAVASSGEETEFFSVLDSLTNLVHYLPLERLLDLNSAEVGGSMIPQLQDLAATYVKVDPIPAAAGMDQLKRSLDALTEPKRRQAFCRMIERLPAGKATHKLRAICGP